MLLLVIFVVLVIVGGIILHLYENSFRGFWDHDWWAGVGSAAIVIGAVGALVLGLSCLIVQVPKDVDYQAALNEREALVYRLENREENIVGNEMLYSEITKFNNALLSAKKWASNPWIGCCYNDLIASIDYIEYREG